MGPEVSILRGFRTAGRADLVAQAGLVVFAFGYVGGKAIANVGLLMLLLAFVVRLPADGRVFLKDPLVRFGLAWMAYVLALAVWAAGRFPGRSSSRPSRRCGPSPSFPWLRWPAGAIPGAC